MKLFITYCSKSKDESLIGTEKRVRPEQLYTSNRIQNFIQECKEAGAYWAIFSDQYGVWFPNEEHEWYEKSPNDVTDSEFAQLVSSSAKRLNKYDVYFFNPEDGELDALYQDLVKELKKRCVNITYFSNIEEISSLSAEQEEYDPSSSVLFLTICSFAKNTEGFTQFKNTNQIFSLIGTQYHDPLKEKRNNILGYLESGKIEFQKGDLKSHSYNLQLTRALDFGGTGCGFYLPAIWRYDGRFFQGLGNHGKKSILASPHHFLIISGLYGLVLPLEPIQCYSVPVNEGDCVQGEWQSEHFLSNLLIAYIKNHSIKRIFDFTGVEHYRDLIDWDHIKRVVNSDTRKVEVLHCFSTLGAGNEALRSFGEVIADHLSLYSEEELLQIMPESQIGPVYFRAINASWPDKPMSLVSANSVRVSLEDIDDGYARAIFQSAEHEFRMFSINDYNSMDAGSTLIWHYAKGVEVLLHSACTRKIRDCIFARSPDIDTSYEEDVVRKILSVSTKPNDENQLTLGNWVYLADKVFKNPNGSIVKQIQACVEKLFGDGFGKIIGLCRRLQGSRNSATHREIYTFEDAERERENIVKHLNSVVSTLFRSPERAKKLAQSRNALDRCEAIASLAGINQPWCREMIVELLGDRNTNVKRAAAEALGKVGDESALPALTKYSESSDDELRYACLNAIGSIQRRIALSERE